MTSWAETVRFVERRARERCEYCCMHQALQGATFHVEHVVPLSCSGPSVPDNLAWACPGCNLKKSNRQTAADPTTGASVSLFNPRTDAWDDHFGWQGYLMVGLTPVGRALVEAFDLNRDRRVLIRQAEELFGFFPP